MPELLYESIAKLWGAIADFEYHEEKNDSKNPILANARRGARMSAYVVLMDREIDKG